MKGPNVRCAVYTRKSTEEGLDQAFNSLDAQREACEAYIQSQAGEGWALLSDQYDDGGFSGGNMDRPGLAKLLEDVSAGRIDVIVVYKIDRLTRSLRDFAKIVDELEKRNASFVSVTQAFNTTTSMGRLTLNVLLSFAQFEREVTAERIRDKIAASRRRGIFMGGSPPLGYDACNRKLVINEVEAETVRHIFRRYLEVKGIAELQAELEVSGIRTKQWVSTRGRRIGGGRWYIGPLRHILRNRVYVGEATHKGASYPGEHAGIIDRDLFDAVQTKLERSRASEVRRKTTGSQALLRGLIFDQVGYAMSPQRSRSKAGKQHVYYVSQARIQKRSGGAPRPIPAAAIEEIVHDRLSCLIVSLQQQRDHAERLAVVDGEELREIVRRFVARVEIHPGEVIIDLHTGALMKELKIGANQLETLCSPNLPAGDGLVLVGSTLRLTVPVCLPLRGGVKRVEGWKSGGWIIPQLRYDPNLIRALAQAHEWQAMIKDGRVRSLDELAKHVKQDRKSVQRVIRLAFLAPDVQRDIMKGALPPRVNLTLLTEADLPMSWVEQRRLTAESSQSNYGSLPTAAIS